MKNLRNRTN